MVVPEDVVRVRVHPSVTVIPARAFDRRHKLEEVELCEGLLEIGRQAFQECSALKRISIPSTVTVIHNGAFAECWKLKELELHEGLQRIEMYAFFQCNELKRLTIPNTVRSIGTLAFCHAYQLRHLQLPEGIENIEEYTFTWNRCSTCRIPPSLTRIPDHFIGSNCQSMFSIELSEGITDIEGAALQECHSLRNVAFPPNAQVEEIDEVFDSVQLYETASISALKHRFDNLPIHKMIYYQSYNNVTSEQLNNATDIRYSKRRSKLNPTGSQQDCLGMTPLHILACSTVQNIELYKVLITKYPETLVIEDRWGAIPLLYAVWGDAPDEIVQFLIESYKMFYPSYKLNWTQMVITIGRVSVLTPVRNLLDIKQESFPEQSIDCNQMINELTKPQKITFLKEDHVSEEVFRYLVKYSLSERISALGPRKWREDIASKLEESFSFYYNTAKGWFDGVSSKLSGYEKEYINLREATTVIELTLWNNQMTENLRVNGQPSKKRVKMEEADLRKQCRVNCGANIIIEHVMPFLTG